MLKTFTKFQCSCYAIPSARILEANLHTEGNHTMRVMMEMGMVTIFLVKLSESLIDGFAGLIYRLPWAATVRNRVVICQSKLQYHKNDQYQITDRNPQQYNHKVLTGS